ncbi:MAG: hypothetical protein K2G42_02045 [Clostridia bacterium]|nr:hypothetical protein [Clostridia bacterium]
MSKINDDEILVLMQYVTKKNKVTIPQIQQEFGWSYFKARQGVETLVEKKKLKFKEGIVYQAITVRSEKFDSFERDIYSYFANHKKDYTETERIFNIKEDEPYILCKEEEAIKSYIQIMDNLYLHGYREEHREESIEEPSKDQVLPQKYEDLTANVKQLVNIAIKFAKRKKSARFGLFQSSLQCKKRTNASKYYNAAICFVDGLTEKEFKVIKRHLTDK